jgi:hypothetical protein
MRDEHRDKHRDNDDVGIQTRLRGDRADEFDHSRDQS